MLFGSLGLFSLVENPKLRGRTAESSPARAISGSVYAPRSKVRKWRAPEEKSLEFIFFFPKRFGSLLDCLLGSLFVRSFLVSSVYLSILRRVL